MVLYPIEDGRSSIRRDKKTCALVEEQTIGKDTMFKGRAVDF